MIVTLTGPSCAGKSTLENLLVERGFAKAISTTTRQPRDGEVDREHYYFTSKSDFKRLLAQGLLVEHIDFNDTFYGLRASEVERLLATGKPIVVVCEPVGQKQIAKYAAEHGWPLLSVFVDNPTAVITERFLRRFHQDMPVRGYDTGSLSDKVTQSYAARLKEMMTTERGWIAEAYAEKAPYHLHLPSFTKENATQVVDAICNYVQERKAA